MSNPKIQLRVALVLLLVITLGWSLIGCVAVPDCVGTVRLNVETYLAGKNQATHPSIVSFDEPWCGFTYWMAYSPYPYGNGEEENPCVAVSNDMMYWETPAGLANPIADNEETGCNELKDPHIVYRDDLNRIEIWYLGRLAVSLGGDGTSLLLMRKYSYDGITWSDYEIMTTTAYLSPSIIWDGEKYMMWSIGYELWSTECAIVYQQSVDGIVWTEPVNCTVGGIDSEIDIWHGGVSYYDGLYHLVYVDNTDKQEIYYCTSIDGFAFCAPEAIVDNAGYWDRLYRPYLLHDGGKTYCLYGVINEENQWYLSMSSGADLMNLIGLSAEDVGHMYPLPNDMIDTHGIRYELKKVYHAVLDYMRIELLVLLLVESVLALLIPKLGKKRGYCFFCVIANAAISAIWIWLRYRPYSLQSILGAAIALCILNIGMGAVMLCISSMVGGVRKDKQHHI